MKIKDFLNGGKALDRHALKNIYGGAPVDGSGGGDDGAGGEWNKCCGALSCSRCTSGTWCEWGELRAC